MTEVAGDDAGPSRDEGELDRSLAGLAGLLGGRGTLESTLVRVAELAVHAIPGAQGAGLTLLEAGRPQTVVASSDFVREVDDVQYSLNEGPCVSAVATGQPVVSGNLGGEPQWPRFGPRVGRLGVHSALSLPLLVQDAARQGGPPAPPRVLGALNVYARGRDVFDAWGMHLGQAFSGPAAVSVANAQLLAQAERLVAQLQEALTSRAEIDQALGIVMSRSGVSAAEAFTRLRSQSQLRQMKVSDIARDLLAEAVTRARSRHAGSETDGRH